MATRLEDMEDPDGAGVGIKQGDAQQTRWPILGAALSLRGAHSPGALALQAQHQQDQEYLAGENFDLRAQKLELDKVKEGVDIQKERTRIADSMELQRQTSKAMTEISALKHDDPDYQEKVLKIGADYPAAMKDETIQKAIAFRDQQFLHTQETQAALSKMAQQQTDELARQQNASTLREGEESFKNALIPNESRMAHAKTAGEIAQFTAESNGYQPEIEGYQKTINDPKADPAAVTEAREALYGKGTAAGLLDIQARAKASLAGSSAQQKEYERLYPGLAETPPGGGAPAGGAAPSATPAATAPTRIKFMPDPKTGELVPVQ